MVVRSQSTAEPAVLPMLTPVAVAVGQVLFERQTVVDMERCRELIATYRDLDVLQ